MKQMETETIQSGWTVVAADGEELGTVIGIDARSIRIKKRGLLGGLWVVPRDAIAEVETGRVDLGLTKKEVQDSQP